jgi:hypothetical protein
VSTTIVKFCTDALLHTKEYRDDVVGDLKGDVAANMEADMEGDVATYVDM